MRHLLHLLTGCLLLIATTACEKDTEADIFAPEVITGTATDIYRKGATLSGSIRFTEGAMAEHYGILFSELQGLAESSELEVTDGAVEFSFSVNNLIPGMTYYYSTYAYSGHNIVLGEVRSFTTSENNAPIFTLPVCSLQSENGFTISTTLIDNGGSELIMVGFCYNEVGDIEPTFQDRVVNIDPSGSSFSAEISGLEPNKTYQVRAYGANESGLSYSGMLLVTTVQESL